MLPAFKPLPKVFLLDRLDALQLPADDLFLPRAGFIQILSSAKSETPPCKSGQLEKDLGLEVSSARHAARLIIFEFMRSFFVGSGAPVADLLDLRYTGTNARNLPHARRQC